MCKGWYGIKSFKKTPHYCLPLQSKCYNLFSGVGKSMYVCAWAYANFIHANFLYTCTLVHIFICIRSAYGHTPHFNERKWLERNSDHCHFISTHTNAQRGGESLITEGDRKRICEQQMKQRKRGREQKQRGKVRKQWMILLLTVLVTLVRVEGYGWVLDIVRAYIIQQSIWLLLIQWAKAEIAEVNKPCIFTVWIYNDTLQRLECVQTCARVHSRRDAECYCRMNIVICKDNLHMRERLRQAMNRDNWYPFAWATITQTQTH